MFSEEVIFSYFIYTSIISADAERFELDLQKVTQFRLNQSESESLSKGSSSSSGIGKRSTAATPVSCISSVEE